MNLRKLFLLIALIFVIGIGSNATAGHRRHHHHRGCGHSGWSLGFSLIVPLNPPSPPSSGRHSKTMYKKVRAWVWDSGCWAWDNYNNQWTWIWTSGHYETMYKEVCN